MTTKYMNMKEYRYNVESTDGWSELKPFYSKQPINVGDEILVDYKNRESSYFFKVVNRRFYYMSETPLLIVERVQ